jgi:hypothetical protein
MRIISQEELYEEEIERRAQNYLESARAEGSLLKDEDLLAEARELAARDVRRIESLADEELDLDDEN